MEMEGDDAVEERARQRDAESRRKNPAESLQKEQSRKELPPCYDMIQQLATYYSCIFAFLEGTMHIHRDDIVISL